MQSLLHLTENRDVHRELQDRKNIMTEQISIFKFISAHCFVAILGLVSFSLWLICFCTTPTVTEPNFAPHLSQRKEQERTDLAKSSKANLENLAFELEENEEQLLRDPNFESELLVQGGNAIQVLPPQVRYKGYYFDQKTKSAIVEVADSTEQIILQEKQKFYSGTAQLMKINKEEIIWKWQGKIYITKIGLN